MPQPHWNTITITPKAAPMLRMFITAAFTATTIERNTNVSSRIDSNSTAAMNQGRRSLTRPPRSPNVAVWPPTWALASLPPSAPGSTSARKRSIVV